MSEQERRQGLDEWIDSLLAEYSDVAPRPGMETRLLATLRAEPLRPDGRGLWRWMLAGGAVLAVTAAVLAIYVSQIPPLPAPPKIHAAGPPLLRQATTNQSRNRPARTAPTRHTDEPAAAVESVRQEIFPTPTPLSEQERLLFRYQAEFPKEKLAALSTGGEPQDGTGPMVSQPQQFTASDGQSIR